MRSRSYLVGIFDEIKKMYPEVFTVRLQVLDNGRLTGSQSCSVDVRHTAIVMTGNLGSQSIQDVAKVSQEAECREYDRPDFTRGSPAPLVYF